MTDNLLQIAPTTLDDQQTHREGAFPQVLACQTPAPDTHSVTAWVELGRASLLEQVARHGAILFRGFISGEPHALDQFVAAFQRENFPYDQSLSNAVRVNFTPRVFSANEAPADVAIFLHHEMAQTPLFPRYIFFCCQQPAETGGMTPLCRSDVLWERIEQAFPDFANQCRKLGLRYSNVMPADDDPGSGMGRSWRSTLRSATRDDAEQRLAELGYEWEWLPDDCLRATTPVLPAVKSTEDGRRVFFNQLIAAARGWKDSRNDPSRAIRFGDGTPLPRETVSQIAQLAEEMVYEVHWGQGDVAIVDNLLVMHGRRPFQGPRRVLASLADAQHNSWDADRLTPQQESPDAV